VAEVYVENDISAHKRRKVRLPDGRTALRVVRPEFRRLLDDLDSGRRDALIVYDIDRCGRDMRDLEDLIDVVEQRRVPNRARTGSLNLSDDAGITMARVVTAMNNKSSRDTARRVLRAQMEAAEEGRWLGGRRPFGWRPLGGGTAVLEPQEAAVVAECTRALLAGRSLGSLITELNERGVRTALGGTWRYTSLRQVVTRARNAGLSEFHGEVVGDSMWPPIVSKDELLAVRALLSSPSRRKSMSNRSRWLLAGVAVCGQEGCGAPLRSGTVVANRRTGRTRTVYRCPEGYHVARDALLLDGFVSAAVVERLSLPEVRSTLTRRGVYGDDPAAEHAVLTARIEELGRMFAVGDITAVTLRAGTEELREKLSAVEVRLTERLRGSVLSGVIDADDVRAAWASLEDDVDRRRAIVREVVEVVVHRANRRGAPGGRGGLDPALIELGWKV